MFNNTIIPLTEYDDFRVYEKDIKRQITRKEKKILEILSLFLLGNNEN